MAAEGRLGEDEARRQVAIPQGVREVVGRRLDRLSGDANEVLGVAAVCGREFRADVIERVSELDRERIDSALAEAVGGRLVEASRRPGRYSFSHALVRETLLAEVPASRRVPLHLEIGEALEQVYAGDLDRHLGELAHHFIEAAPLGEVDRAVDYATRAAARARERLAYEDAAALTEKALDALELAPEPDRSRRLELLLELGSEQTKAARQVEARRALEEAAALARELDRPEELARAALGICLLSLAGVVDEDLIDLLDEALELIGPEDSPLRSQLLSRPRPGALLGRRRRALQRPRPRGARDGPAPRRPRRRWRSPWSGASSPARSAPSRCAGGCARATSCTTWRSRAATASSSCARTCTGCPGLPGARRGARGRCRARRDRAAGDRAAPADLRLERAAAAGDAGGDRRALRRRRAPRGRGARGGPPGGEPVSAQFYATQIALLRRLRRAPEDDEALAELTDRLGGARRAVPGDPGVALLARRDPRRARARGRGAKRLRDARRGRLRRPAPRPAVDDLAHPACRDGRLPRRPRARRAPLRAAGAVRRARSSSPAAPPPPTDRLPGCWRCSRERSAVPRTPSATSATRSRSASGWATARSEPGPGSSSPRLLLERGRARGARSTCLQRRSRPRRSSAWSAWSSRRSPPGSRPRASARSTSAPRSTS